MKKERKSLKQLAFNVNMKVRVFSKLNDREVTWLYQATKDEMAKRRIGLNGDRNDNSNG